MISSTRGFAYHPACELIRWQCILHNTSFKHISVSCASLTCALSTEQESFEYKVYGRPVYKQRYCYSKPVIVIF